MLRFRKSAFSTSQMLIRSGALPMDGVTSTNLEHSAFGKECFWIADSVAKISFLSANINSS